MLSEVKIRASQVSIVGAHLLCSEKTEAAAIGCGGRFKKWGIDSRATQYIESEK